MSDEGAIATIRTTGRIWAVGSIHGEADSLRELHAALAERLQPGDSIVYLGNYLGYGPQILETVGELLAFRRAFLARSPYTATSDFVMLRGSQEEMWQRVLQLQFALDPGEVMKWMAARGVAETLAAYAGSSQQELLGSKAGPLTIAQWTSSVRAAIREFPGHVEFMSALKRAARTGDGALLFVNTGVDTMRPVHEQSDSFWWAGRSFAGITGPVGSFRRVVRGFDPDGGGYKETEFTVTVDGGCGFGGALLAACLTPAGDVVDLIECPDTAAL